ncbi:MULTISPECIES: ABC transporter substrate-binding protein [Symbiopectobacterium]|uniref:ABC transporter substrate-binding protein n=1 Tax=Symbiopectobacterium TaxID=801 RepID=UPI00207AA5B3|nr:MULTISPECIES: ABC transporter substrate-binding protein [Symbiopectobacterium]MBT9430161.1 hypothetical protein [Candidatus Symbiopectobacterium endolongispinus]
MHHETAENLAPVPIPVHHERGQYIVATRNSDYWREGQPYIERIVWRIITDKSAATAALETGQVQLSAYSQLSLADLDRLQRHPDF